MDPPGGSLAAGGLHIPHSKGCVDGVVGSLLVEWPNYMLHLEAALGEVDIGGREPRPVRSEIVEMLKYSVLE